MGLGGDLVDPGAMVAREVASLPRVHGDRKLVACGPGEQFPVAGSQWQRADQVRHRRRVKLGAEPIAFPGQVENMLVVGTAAAEYELGRLAVAGRVVAGEPQPPV